MRRGALITAAAVAPLLLALACGPRPAACWDPLALLRWAAADGGDAAPATAPALPWAPAFLPLARSLPPAAAGSARAWVVARGRPPAAPAPGAAATTALTNVAIIPGGLLILPADSMFWYASLQRCLEAALPWLPIELRSMPSPFIATASAWLPFMRNELRVGPGTIVVGHSSGAVASMRYAEKNKVAGLVLVAAYSTDLGLPTEKASGFFDAPWDWAAIRANAGFIIQLASPDDFLVPFEEQRRVAAALGSDFRTIPGRGHFLQGEVPEVAAAVISEAERLRGNGGGPAGPGGSTK